MLQKISLISAVAGFALLGAGCFSASAPQPTASAPVAPASSLEVTTEASAPGQPAPAVQVIAEPVAVPKPSAAASLASKVGVAITNYAFLPATLTVKAGTTVVWTNNDSVPHTVTANNKAFDSGIFSKGESYSRTFLEVGTFPYFCALHPSMQGSVTVTQ